MKAPLCRTCGRNHALGACNGATVADAITQPVAANKPPVTQQKPVAIVADLWKDRIKALEARVAALEAKPKPRGPAQKRDAAWWRNYRAQRRETT